MQIKLKDNSVLEVQNGATVLDVAKQISEGLARNAIAGCVNGHMVQLSSQLKDGDMLEVITLKDERGMEVMRHSTAHIMALAVKRLYPDVKITIGPAIKDGFYYDFDFSQPISSDDLPKIEEEMAKIIKAGLKFERGEITREQGISLFSELGETYKVEILKEIPEGEIISTYQLGEYIDLCRGPHLEDITIVKAFKLQSATGAYWRGDEHNKMLTRVYGTCFPKKSELDEYLERLEQAKLRDHRKIGKEQELFMFSDMVGKGLPMWLPNGFILRKLLSDYIMDKEMRAGYKHVLTPCIGSSALYKTSGHWAHYKDDMFPSMKLDDEEYVLRPMNCPHHMMLFKNSMHSYKDLPLRIAEIATDFRYEASGTLLGLERTRWLTQNDSHIFCRPDQIKSEVEGVVRLILDVYKDFGFNDYKFRLSLRDKNSDKYFPNDELWEKSEAALRQILIDNNVDFYEAEGEAAFYGPKIDIQVYSAIGHEVTLSTIQLDYQLPERFELEYIDENAEKQRPVVIHRAILGSLGRFTAFLIEHFAGAFPLWLSPVQVKVLSLTDRTADDANNLVAKLNMLGLRAEADNRNEKIGYKIREAQLHKVPYMVIIGDKEHDEGTVSVRDRKKGDLGSMNINDFVKMVKNQNDSKALD